MTTDLLNITIISSSYYITRAFTPILFLLTCSYGYSQAPFQSEIDSLVYKLETISSKEDKFKVLMELSSILQEENKDTAIHFAREAMKIALESKQRFNNAEAKRQLGILVCGKGLLDSGLTFLDEAIELFSALNEKKEVFDTRYDIARIYAQNAKSKEAAICFEELLSEIDELNISDSLTATIYSNLGLMYQYTGRSNKALENHLKGMKLKEQMNNRSGIAKSHDNLGVTFFELKDYEKAMEHYNKALSIYEELKDTINILRRGYAIGGGFYALKKYDEARLYLEQTLEVAEKYNHLSTIINCYQVLGLIHLKKDEYKKAEIILTKAQDRFPASGPTRMLVYIKSNLAVLYLNWGTDVKVNRVEHLKKAIVLSEETERLCEETSFLLLQKKSVEVLYKAHKELGKFENALDYSIKYMAISDSLLTEQKQNAIVEMEEKYEAEKKDLEINILSKEKAIEEINLANSELERRRQERLIYLLIGIATLIFVFGAIVYRFYRQKQKANKALVTQNEIISKQKEENEVLLKEIHHRVKNNMQIISSLLDLQSRGSKDESATMAIQEGQNRVQAMSLIHEMLYQNENMAEINIGSYIHKLFDQILQLHKSSDQAIDYKINVAPNIQLNLDIAIPLGLILTELITNSFKYAFKETENAKVEVNLRSQNESEFLLEVSDNGKGLPDNFDFKKIKSLGLRLVKTLTKQIQGSMDYETSNGTLFYFTFPKEVKLN